MNSTASPPKARPTPQQAAREILRRQAATSNLLDFVRYTKPDYAVNWHHRLVCRYVDEVVAGRCRRLMVFMHPRAGKSEVISRRLPAYYLGRHPDRSIIATSYSADLAGKMNRDVQRIIDGDAYHRLFPQTCLYGKAVRSTSKGAWVRNTDEFEVVNHRGGYRSAGVGGGVAGRGADLILVDDYLKNAAEARSDTIRNAQWEWFTSDLSTRQMPGCAIVIICTRWSWDDVPGRLLRLAEEDDRAEPWTVLKLPAIAEKERAHPDDPRSPGEALWPEWYGLDFLNRQRATLGPYAFEALYQQNPTPKEGGLFTEAGLSNLVDAPPAIVRNRVRAYDKGYSAEGDWTVGVLMSRSNDGLFFIEDVARFRLPPHERNRRIKQIAEEDDRRYGRRVPIVIEQPPGAGAETTGLLVRELAGHVVHARAPRGDKSERAEPLAAQCGAGNVRFVRGPWVRAFQEECLTFPLGIHDDQVDAASWAFIELVTPSRLNLRA